MEEKQKKKSAFGFTLVPTDDNCIIFKNEFLGYDGIIVNASTAHEESNWQNIGNGAEVDFLKKRYACKAKLESISLP